MAMNESSLKNAELYANKAKLAIPCEEKELYLESQSLVMSCIFLHHFYEDT